jgi:hypothetical protein
MGTIDDLIASYSEIRDQMLADIDHWKEHGMKLDHKGVDVTEKWLANQKERAESLSGIIAAHEKHRDENK